MVEPSKKTRNGLELNPLEGLLVKVVISEGSRLESIHHSAHCPSRAISLCIFLVKQQDYDSRLY